MMMYHRILGKNACVARRHAVLSLGYNTLRIHGQAMAHGQKVLGTHQMVKSGV